MQSFKHQHTKQCVIENNNNKNRFRHIALQSKGNLSYESSMRVQNSWRVLQVRWTINSTNVGKDIQLCPTPDVVGNNGSDKSIKSCKTNYSQINTGLNRVYTCRIIRILRFVLLHQEQQAIIPTKKICAYTIINEYCNCGWQLIVQTLARTYNFVSLLTFWIGTVLTTVSYLANPITEKNKRMFYIII
jgi:hypothetical protein